MPSTGCDALIFRSPKINSNYHFLASICSSTSVRWYGCCLGKSSSTGDSCTGSCLSMERSKRIGPIVVDSAFISPVLFWFPTFGLVGLKNRFRIVCNGCVIFFHLGEASFCFTSRLWYAKCDVLPPNII